MRPGQPGVLTGPPLLLAASVDAGDVGMSNSWFHRAGWPLTRRGFLRNVAAFAGGLLPASRWTGAADESAGGREDEAAPLGQEFLETFLLQHDFVYERPAMEWHRGMPLANAQVGAVLWGDGRPLVLTLDRNDLWELRRKPIDWSTYNYANLARLLEEGDGKKVYEVFGQRFEEDMYHGALSQTRLTPGRVEVDFGELATEYAGRLSLYTAIASGTIGRGAKRAKYRCFVSAVRDLILLDIDLPHDVPMPEVRSRPSKFTFPKLGYPSEERGQSGDIHWRLQRQTDGREYAVAWGVLPREEQQGGTLFISIQGSDQPDRAIDRAVEEIQTGMSVGMKRLEEEHRDWWRQFWAKSWLTIPDSRLENLYYAELYKSGCQIRQGKPFISGQGVWCPDDTPPPWAAQYGFNLNEQMDTWHLLPSNHVDSAYAFVELLERWLPVNREICRKFYGVDGATLIHGSDFNGHEVPGWYCANLWAACGPWACHTLWMVYRHTQDVKFLRERAYPLMKAHMAQYKGILKKGDGGKWHVPWNPSPEWLNNDAKAWGQDDTGNLASIRWLSDALLETEQILKIESDDQAWWRDVRENLAPYAVDRSGFQLMRGVPLTESHRTFPQLLAIYPYGDVHIEGSAEDRELIRRSFATVTDRGPGKWCGYTLSWMAVIAARAADAGRALEMLKLYTDVSVLENSFHTNSDYQGKGVMAQYPPIVTPEGGLTAAAAILEVLLQSWNGVIRVFPAMPGAWHDAAFENLRAEGGFLVSARRRRGQTTWLRIRSEAGSRCRLRNPFQGAAKIQRTGDNGWQTVSGEMLEFATASGGEYVLVPERGPSDSSMPDFQRDAHEQNWFGVKALPRLSTRAGSMPASFAARALDC
jgi:alpha-L-fucosidase 2